MFGIFGHPDAAAITALGLHALQHRGQEAAGIVSFDGQRFHSERRLGLVGDTFSKRQVIDRLPGMSAVGHVRYSTTGETLLRNVQPLFAELNPGGFAIGHNGNLTNGLTLRRELVREGAIMQSTTDTEVILHLVARSRKPPLRRPLHRRPARAGRRLFLRRPDQQEAGRRARPARHPSAGARQARRLPDPRVGNLRARHHRREICARHREWRSRGVRRARRAQRTSRSRRCAPRPCIFEYIYFSRPDSVVGGRSVYEVRKTMGARACARGAGAHADVIVPVPDSGVPAAIGYAQAMRHPLRTRHHPQPLCRPHLHRADAADPRARRAAEAQCQPRRGARASASCWSTIPSCAAPPRPRS